MSDYDNHRMSYTAREFPHARQPISIFDGSVFSMPVRNKVLEMYLFSTAHSSGDRSVKKKHEQWLENIKRHASLCLDYDASFDMMRRH